MGTEQAHYPKELEKEKARLKRLVADLSLDKAILKATARGNFSARTGAGKPCGRFRRPSSFPSGV